MVARQAALQHLSAFSVQVSASEYFSCRCAAIARLIMQLALALSTACAIGNAHLSHEDGLDGVMMATDSEYQTAKAPASYRYPLVHSMLQWQSEQTTGRNICQKAQRDHCIPRSLYLALLCVADIEDLFEQLERLHPLLHRMDDHALQTPAIRLCQCALETMHSLVRSSIVCTSELSSSITCLWSAGVTVRRG